MNVRVAFDGGEELAAALRQLSTRGAKAVQREALEEGAAVIRQGIASRAPRRPPAPDLADHIVVSRVNETGERGGGYAIGPLRGRFFYGSFVEYGTSRTRARPFMRPGFDATVETSLGVVGRALWRELAAKGITRRATAPSTPTGPGRTV